MAWPQLEATTPHLTYLLLSLFLILYALFSELIRNRLHLSEPPLATLAGIICGPLGLGVLNPRLWGWRDNAIIELTRIVLGVQVFASAIELPKRWMGRHWTSLLMLLGPVMGTGWVVSAVTLKFVVGTSWRSAWIVGACLTPTDPVLSASVLGEARFSTRVPGRLKRLLSAESGCNDGIAFPILYAGLFAVTKSTGGEAFKSWFLDVVVWQCVVGTAVGIVIGLLANYLLKLSEKRGFILDFSLFVFYFLLAIFCVGVGSSLGVDDFLVCFGAGTAFAWDGWFHTKTENVHLPAVIDLLLNSTLFVYFGAIIPWGSFTNHLSAGRLFGCLVIILIFRRIPALLALYRWIPDLKNYHEALFTGHFGPMGVGALFLAIEARARLETGTSVPLPGPPEKSPHLETIEDIWPIICFIVIGSIVVHGLSAMVMSLVGHYTRHEKERAPLIGAETERLYGMASSLSGSRESSEASDQE